MSGFAPPSRPTDELARSLERAGERAALRMQRIGEQIDRSMKKAFAPIGARAMKQALDAAAAEPEGPTLQEQIVDALREWRWYKHGELYRGETPYSVQAGAGGDVRLAKLIELIDEYDIAMGFEEPRRSLVKRGRITIEKFERDGLSEDEVEKILAWLGEEHTA